MKEGLTSRQYRLTSREGYLVSFELDSRDIRKDFGHLTQLELVLQISFDNFCQLREGGKKILADKRVILTGTLLVESSSTGLV